MICGMQAEYIIMYLIFGQYITKYGWIGYQNIMKKVKSK